MLPEEGFKILKKILERHSLQRPPFSTLIFDPETEVPKIIEFTLSTFFRHFGMYEFAFKPRRELILKTEPYLSKRFNAEQHDLGEMQLVEGEEADKMKGYLQLFAPEGVTSAFEDI